MTVQSSLCVIPARGGSKRIEKKNTRSFLGKPIVAYSIDAALASECFEEVMVSTDDPEIAEISAERLSDGEIAELNEEYNLLAVAAEFPEATVWQVRR